MPFITEFGYFEILMKKKVLVSYADFRSLSPAHQIAKSTQKFIKIHDYVWSGLANHMGNEPYRRKKASSMYDIVQYCPHDIGTFVPDGWNEVERIEITYMRGNPINEKIGQFPYWTSAYKDIGNFMAMAQKHLFHRHGLCKMSPSFSLDYKKIFHDQRNSELLETISV
jgi:hypothetical protein